MIPFINYSQNFIAEKNAVKTFYQYSECKEQLSLSDSIISTQSSLIKVCEQTLDSTKFILNSAIMDAKNLEKNAKQQIASEKKKAAIKNLALEILIPAVIIETIIILKR